MVSFGGFGASWAAVKVRSSLGLLGVVTCAVACSEGSTDPIPSAGAGGVLAAGGASGSGGLSTAGTSSGGSGGGSGAVALRTFDFAEAGDTAEWLFVYAEPPSLIAPAVSDAGADAGTAAPPPEGVATVAHDAQEGDPELGSAVLGLPFDGPNQKISFEVNVAVEDVGLNLSGKSISVRIRVDSGLALDPMNPAGIKLYVKTGPDSVYADSGFINLAAGTEWQTLVWPNVATPGYIDTARGAHAPTDVQQVGIEFATGAAGTYAPAVAHVDTLFF